VPTSPTSGRLTFKGTSHKQIQWLEHQTDGPYWWHPSLRPKENLRARAKLSCCGNCSNLGVARPVHCTRTSRHLDAGRQSVRGAASWNLPALGDLPPQVALVAVADDAAQLWATWVSARRGSARRLAGRCPSSCCPRSRRARLARPAAPELPQARPEVVQERRAFPLADAEVRVGLERRAARVFLRPAHHFRHEVLEASPGDS